MALCNKCINTDAEYETLRAEFDDVDMIGGDKREKHYCRMFNDTIPNSIYYDGEQCPWYERK